MASLASALLADRVSHHFARPGALSAADAGAVSGEAAVSRAVFTLCAGTRDAQRSTGTAILDLVWFVLFVVVWVKLRGNNDRAT